MIVNNPFRSSGIFLFFYLSKCIKTSWTQKLCFILHNIAVHLLYRITIVTRDRYDFRFILFISTYFVHPASPTLPPPLYNIVFDLEYRYGLFCANRNTEEEIFKLFAYVNISSKIMVASGLIGNRSTLWFGILLTRYW